VGRARLPHFLRWRPSVLGRLTARLLGPLEAERPHVVIGWPLGADGRKWEGGSALYAEGGELKGYARGLWIELRKLSA
jgi:hypothetical protein